jgi:S-DNA-T family DNA segregation ATPase FtsK/SpoIIIE
VYFDLDSDYHLFVCGAIGGGKSVEIKGMTIQIIHKSIEGEEVIIIIADFKGGLDYSKYKKHLKIITDIKELLKITNILVAEMKKREKIIEESGHENFQTYNQNEKVKLKRMVLVIDEIVEALELDGLDRKDDADEIKTIKKIIKNLSKLARLCRALGINLIFGTQLPTAKCIVNQIKNNIPSRVCYKFPDKSASMVVLDSPKASSLPETKGRMIYKNGGTFRELQTPFINNAMIEDYFSMYGDKVKVSGLLKDEVREKANKKEFEKPVELDEMRKKKRNQNM